MSDFDRYREIYIEYIFRGFIVIGKEKHIY